MSVVRSIEDVGPCRKQVKVEVPAPAVEAETQRVVDEFKKRARLPGFRKGKVPSELIRQKYREDIEQEVVERLLPRYWRQAEAEKELDPLLPPNVDEVDLQPGEALTFVASVETRPVVELGDIGTFDLPEMDVEPTEDEIEKTLEEMRRAVAEWIDVERPAAQGDLILADLEELDGETSSESKTISFEVGEAQVWEELSLEATGKSAGQTGEFERREEVEGEESSRRFKLSIKEVKERDLPPLDDALASKLGEFEHQAALRKDLIERMRQSKHAERRQKRERAALEQLQDRHPLELPAGVIDHEIEGMLRDYAQNLAGSGIDLQDPNLDWQGMAERVRPQAEKRVHARLLLDAIAGHLELEVAEDEFEATLAALASAQKRSAVSVRQELDRSGRLAALREQLAREKALKHLLGEELETAEEPETTDNQGRNHDPHEGA